MSVARGLGQNGGHYYSNITQPVKIDLQFTIASTNANGLGIVSLKSNGYVRNVFMHTTVAPGVNDGATNPNPMAGVALIQLNNNFNHYLGMNSAIVSPMTGGALAVTLAGANLVAGQPYIITAVGTTTAAQWHSLGLPAGLTPAVGQSFIALITGIGVGTGFVKAVGVSGVSCIEVIGAPDLEIANSSIAQNGGAYVMLQFLGATAAGNTALIPTAPADTSIVSMSLYFDASSVSIDGL